mgnify:CR=1 FL=1
MDKRYLALIILVLSFVSCENEPVDFEVNDDTDTKWWILTRTNNNNIGEPEIVLYNETTSTIEKKIDLPSGFSSPHALDYDGESLWIGGFHGSASILQLSPIDGAILTEIENIRTQGIACIDNYIYYSGSSNIYKIDRQGVPIETIPTQSSVIQDIAITNLTIYYVFNGSIDPIIRINPTNSTEETITETEVTGLNTLAIHNDHLIVTTNSNAIRRFDINSGERISDTETIIEGWITAIVPYLK